MKKYLIFFLILATSILAYSQDNENKKKLSAEYQIVVTASKTDVPLEQTTRDVIIISREEINESHSSNLIELLKDKTGIVIAETGAGPGANSSLFVRGANSNYNLILIDGVQVNMPGGDYNLGNLSLEGVDHIEIVKGPASVLYGPNAASSVINIITKKEKEHNSKVSFSAGNYKTYYESAEINVSRSITHASIYGSRLDSTRELKINNAYYRNILGINLHNNFGQQGSLQMQVHLSDSKDDYPTGSAGDRFLPLDLYDPHQNIKTKELLFLTNYSWLHNKWQPILKFSFTRLSFNFNDPDDGAVIDPFGAYIGTNTAMRYALEWQNNITLNSHILTSGLEYQHETFESTDNYSSLPYKGNRDNAGIYLQDQWASSKKNVFLTEAIRVDKNSQYKLAVAPQFSYALAISTASKIKGSIGLGFKAPTFWQTLGSAYATGNPNLKPEKSFSTDITMEYALKRSELALSGTLFYSKFFDLIEFIPHYNSRIPDYVNLSNAHSYGTEISVHKIFYTHYSLHLNYTFTKAENESDKTAIDYFQKALLRRPEHSASLTVHYSKTPVHFSFTSLFVGKRVDLDYTTYSPEKVMMPSYLIFNMSADYTFYSHYSLTFRIENILNKSYEEVFGFTAKRRTLLIGISRTF